MSNNRFTFLERKLIGSYLDDIKACYELNDLVKVYKIITTLTTSLDLHNELVDEDITRFCKGEISFKEVMDKIEEVYFQYISR